MLIEQDTSKNSYASRLGANILQMGCEWKPNISIPFTRMMFTIITQYLAELRNKEDGTYAVELHNDYQNPDSAVIFAAVLEKHDAAEGKSYSLSFTFDGEDVPADAKHINIADTEPVAFITEAMNRSIDVYNNERFQFNFNVKDGLETNKYSLFMSFRGVVITLKEYARNNVMNEDNKFEFKGYFTLTASVADDGKVFVKIVPSEGLKQIIKDDSSIEKHEDGTVSFAA